MTESGHWARVCIVDDNPRFCRSLTALLESERIQVKAFTNGQEFLDSISPDMYQCLVLDLNMPDLDGHAIQRRLNNKGLSIPIIILSAHLSVPITVKSMKLGAMTVIEKSQDVDELLSTIREAIARDHAAKRVLRRTTESGIGDVEAQLAAKLKRFKLSKRQSEIAKLICESMSNEEMAQQLNISSDTVKMHIRALYKKLGVNDRVGVVMKMLAMSDLQRGSQN